MTLQREWRGQARRTMATEQVWQPVGISELEDAAWGALRDEGCTAVVAGPGAGKTEFLAQRAAFLLQTGVCLPPRRILAISFKRDSAVNLARRVATRVPEHSARFVSQTFDAFTKGLVDRFRAVLPFPWTMNDGYDLGFWNARDQRDFLSDLASSAPDDLSTAIHGSGSGSFLADSIGSWPLPLDPTVAPTSATEFAAWSWWNKRFLIPNKPQIDFVMLNRLAELLIRTNPQIRRALRSTYPFVFVDEFQDTTAAQLSFLETAFGGSAVVTVVGDSKQRIMGFAGALEDSFATYAKAFGATTYPLTWNFRSSNELVLLQRIIASRLAPGSAETVSKASVEEGHIAASIWSYKNADREVTHIAKWIANDIASSGRAPSDFALVVRQKAADYEDRFRTALAACGIQVRNDDAKYGVMSLQDLTKHEITRLILGMLKLAAEPRGHAREWHEVTAILARIYGVTEDDVSSRELSDRLAKFSRDLRSWLQATPVATADAGDIVSRAAEFIRVEDLTGYLAAQQRGENATDVLVALAHRLKAVLPGAVSWGQAFADVEAANAVSLLTIHRSKGLEYHTVFFLGLDDDQWWSYKQNEDEETATFFVGLSRAAQRLVFTSTKAGARTGDIAQLYAMLDEAGVKESQIP